MQFNCKLCNYETGTKYCYQKHLKTKKHNENINKTKIVNQTNEHICNFCNNRFTTASSLARHHKSCIQKNQLIHVVSDKDKEIEHLKDEIKHLNDKIDMFQSENRNLKTIVTNAGSIIKTSVSTLSYVMKNYTNAPALEQLIDYDSIQYNEKDDEFDLMKMIFHHHRKRSLAGYLGDFIVKSYKKNDPSQQALWNSDAVRLNYIVREIINKKTDWTVDKGGIKTTSYIIDPFLEYIRTLLVDFNDDNKLEDFLHDNIIRMKQRMDNLNASAEIIADIKNKVLSEQIIKYIAPHFYLSKNNELIAV